MGEVLDLDAARAARAEAEGDAPSIVLNGETFVLPVRLSMNFSRLWGAGNLDGAMELLLGEERAAAFFALDPDVRDMKAIVEGIGILYGLAEPGNSSASIVSSNGIGPRSKPTSNGSASTSRKRAGGKRT